MREFHGILEKESAEEIEKIIREKRKEHKENHKERTNQIKKI